MEACVFRENCFREINFDIFMIQNNDGPASNTRTTDNDAQFITIYKTRWNITA